MCLSLIRNSLLPDQTLWSKDYTLPPNTRGASNVPRRYRNKAFFRRGKGRECLKSLFRTNSGSTDDLMFLGIVHHYIRLAIENLDPVFVIGMKALARLVYRECHVFPGGMPRGINQGGNCLLRFRI